MRPPITKLILLTCLLAVLPPALPSCTNNPYRRDDSQGQQVYYDDFSEEPKYLDPAKSYSSDEYRFLQQIYEAPLTYHYLKRPFELIPLTIEQIPEPAYYDKDGNPLPPDAPPDAVAKAVYELTIKPGIRFQEHACFATKPDGGYRWHLGPDGEFPAIDHPNELGELGSRELRAEDYAYQIKRLAHPELACPLFSLFAKYIDGFEELGERLGEAVKQERARREQKAHGFYRAEEDEDVNPIHLDLREFDFPGVEVVDARTFRIVLKKKYPQFKYWLAMPFFAPMPWEADRFYTQAAAVRQSLTLDRFPVGTGPFMMTFNQANWRIELSRNPNFRLETYPSEGMPEDGPAGLLADAGQPLPFLDRLVYSLEKESIPNWNKFLQGYYDSSVIYDDVFDQAVQVKIEGAELSEAMQAKDIRLMTAISPTIYYYAFNMLDPVVGGLNEKKRKLRQAISIAFEIEEYIEIFKNGRGMPAQGPVAPGIVGFMEGREGLNPLVFEWDEQAQGPKRRPLAAAKELLAQAGYGRDGERLILYFEGVERGADTKAEFDWLRKQFNKLDIELRINATTYSQFRDKVRRGDWQILRWGWHADYPDPENFLFLLYGPNGKVKSQGENASNYQNPRFDALFEQMENMENSPERMTIIRELIGIVRADAPWFGTWNPIGYGLFHSWYQNAKPMSLGYGFMKFKKIDAALRAQKRAEWNPPILWPIVLLFALLVAVLVPATVVIYRRERKGGDA